MKHSANLAGRSLSLALRGEDLPDVDHFGSVRVPDPNTQRLDRKSVAVYHESYKYVLSGEQEFTFDLKTDPGEADPLDVSELYPHLLDHLRRQARAHRTRERSDRIEALSGYRAARKIEELTSNLGSANQVVDDKQAEIERLSPDLRSRDAEIQQLQEKAGSSSQEIERLNHEIAGRDTAVEVRDREINVLRGDATLARQQVAELQEEVASLLGSESWRVTRPLRGLANRLMRRKRLWALLMWCYRLATGTSTPSLNAES